jgi:hypothetical protein
MVQNLIDGAALHQFIWSLQLNDKKIRLRFMTCLRIRHKASVDKENIKNINGRNNNNTKVDGSGQRIQHRKRYPC